MRQALIPTTLPTLAILAAAPALAQATLADPAALDRVVEQFTGQPLGQPGGARAPVDRRMRLRACPAGPQASWHGAPGRTVVVACPEPGGWRVFVNLIPAGLAASGVDAPVAPRATIKRGESLTVAVTGRGFAIRRPAEALEAGAVGDWIAVRTTRDGEPLRARIVQPGLAEIPLP